MTPVFLGCCFSGLLGFCDGEIEIFLNEGFFFVLVVSLSKSSSIICSCRSSEH